MSADALKRAIEVAGSQSALAAAVGKTQGHVTKWLQRQRVPAEVVLPIERATGVSRHELRPDIFGELEAA